PTHSSGPWGLPPAAECPQQIAEERSRGASRQSSSGRGHRRWRERRDELASRPDAPAPHAGTHGQLPDRVREASARRKKLPSVTTRSPVRSPSVTSTPSPAAAPTLTG